MKLINYSLKVNSKQLLDNVNITFENGKINHLLGLNGVGKSCLAKDLYNKFEIELIGSYSNLPKNWKVKTLLSHLELIYGKRNVDVLSDKLNISNIDKKLLIRKLSDGQKQKLKIITFMLSDKDIIILDELTNALDRTTVIEIYDFLNNYIKNNPKKLIINITHNINDLREMAGKYYILSDQNIKKVEDLKKAIEFYIGGDTYENN